MFAGIAAMIPSWFTSGRTAFQVKAGKQIAIYSKIGSLLN